MMADGTRRAELSGRKYANKSGHNCIAPGAYNRRHLDEDAEASRSMLTMGVRK